MKFNIATMMAAALLMVTGLTAPVYAEGPGGDLKDRKEWKQRMESKMQGLFKELNLTEEQRKQLDDNRKKNREAMETLRKSMREYKDQMRQELQKETLDMNKINGLQEQIKEAQAKIIDNRLHGILEVHKILTPEQFKKFSEHMEKRKAGFRNKGWKQKEGLGKEGPGDDLRDGPPEGPLGNPPDGPVDGAK